MSHVTTHILDTSIGRPAAGVSVALEFQEPGGWQLVSSGITDSNGRISNLIPDERRLPPGVYRLTFDTKSYFYSTNSKTFYPAVYIEFEITDDSHYHVPLFLNTYGSVQSTQDEVLKTMKLLQGSQITQHLEVETYTWDVLPPSYKMELSDSIVRELEWVKDNLAA